MPEIKHNFTGGKMNKDVDQRLVPKGEYRDAMNIQVSTSEGSDVGTVQNILGNKNIEFEGPMSGFNITDFTCVGSYADEKTDSSYWFLRGPESYGKNFPAYNDIIKGTFSKDYILKLTNDVPSIVFTDTKEITSKAEDHIATGQDAIDASNNIIHLPSTWAGHLSVGDTLRSIVDGGVFYSQNSKIIYIHEAAFPGDEEYVILDKLTWTQSGSGYFGLLFKSNCLNFQEDSAITGINIIDDILIWTDNHNEPKMLNIPRSKQYTDQSGDEHTKLYNPALIGLQNWKKVEPHHIQVIKRKPTHALSIEQADLRRSGIIYGQSISYQFSNPSGILFNDGYEGVFNVYSGTTTNCNYNQGDVLVLLNTDDQTSPNSNRSLPEQYDVKVLITDITHYGSGLSEVDFEIISIGSTTPFILTDYTSRLMEANSTLFDEEMFRFSYRYRYLDGEVSGFAPWSKTVFVSGEFKYNQKNAYNYGMLNSVTDLTLKDFIDYPNTLNVVSVDLLVKNDNAPSIYLIDTIRREEFPGTVPDANGNPFGGNYSFNPKQIQATIPENQSLRAFDNVPRKALAQEITGNRLVFGNYTEAYDYDSNYINLNPGVTARPLNIIQPRDGNPSIKTQRNYQVGMVLVDKEGRESPIITSENANVDVPKGMLDTNTMLTMSNSSFMPSWVNSYKYYIKDSSKPAYNLVIDSFYKAENGDYWVSVPSSERNKVQEGDLIELKKGIDDNRPLLTPLRTKVIAIENEAPEFIKINYRKIGRSPAEWETGVAPNVVTTELFADDGRPGPDKDWFKIFKTKWMDENIATYGGGADLVGLDLAFSFTAADTSGGVIGNSYKTRLLTGQATHYADPSNVDAGTWVIRLDEPIDEANDWMLDATNTNSGLNTTLNITVYEKELLASSEFHGKFFMKLEAKQDLVDSIVPKDLVLTEEVILNSIPVRNLCDGHWFTGQGTTQEGVIDGLAMTSSVKNGQTDVYNTNTNLNWGSSTNMTDTWEKWKELLQYYYPYQGWQDQVPQHWFIDRMFFKRIQNADNIDAPTYSGSSVSGGHGLGVFKCTADQAVGDGNLTPSYNQLLGSGDNLGWLTQDKWYMELSVTGMMKRINIDGAYLFPIIDIGTPSGSGPNGEDSAWDIRYRRDGYGPFGQGYAYDANGSDEIYDATNQDVAMTFIPNVGTKFKWDGGQEVFTITKVKWELRWNHTNVEQYNNWFTYIEPTYGGSWSTGTHPAFLDPDNRRLTFILELDKDPTTDPNIDPTNKTQVNATNPVDMIFLDQTVEVGPGDPVLSTNNPAIFEVTQPDEEKLDIYHEASNEIPIELNYPNLSRLVPVGSKVTYSGDASLLSGSVVTSITEGVPSKIIINNAIGGVSGYNAWQGAVINGDKLTFVTPSGDSINITLQEVSNGQTSSPILTPVSSTLGSNFHIGLGWSNCISFRNGVESVYLKDDYNEKFLSKGVKVSSTLDKEYKTTLSKSRLIYSGIFNSTSDINNLNQFIAAEKITKDLNPVYGSIQKLYSRSTADGDLIALCEDRVLKILASKDALYNADGNTNVTSTNNVLGTAIPYSGEFGISKNPESFASDAYRIYFTDKVRGTVMRLSKDGLTPISNHGMKDWFRDNLKLGSKLIGSHDDKKDEYNITIKGGTIAKTVTFREDVKGWVSFKSFTPENAISCANEYYTFKDSDIWKHHDELVDRNTFYNQDLVPSSVEVIFNEVPGSVKSFKTVNYEGSQAKVTLETNDNEYFNLEDVPGWHVIAKDGVQGGVVTNLERGGITEFIKKEGKWFGYVVGDDVNVSVLGNISSTSNYDTEDFSIQGVGSTTSVVSSIIFGCMDDGGSTNLDVFGDGSNVVGIFASPSVPGTAAFNYISAATNDDGSCIDMVMGCIDPIASNTDGNANTDDGSCIYPGCTIPLATLANEMSGGGSLNFDPNANFDDGSCTMATYGCTLSGFFNSNIFADFGSSILETAGTFCGSENCMCIPVIYGCTDPNASNPPQFVYELTDINTDDGSCTYLGCTDPLAENYDPMFAGSTVDGPNGNLTFLNGTAVDDLSCTYIGGCTDDTACNYDADATQDDGLCYFCGDDAAVNYDAATPDYICTGTCTFCEDVAGVTIDSQTTAALGTSNGTITIEWPESTSATLYEVYGAGITTATITPSGNAIETHTITGLGTGTYTIYVSTLCTSDNGVTLMAGNQLPGGNFGTGPYFGTPVSATITVTPQLGCTDNTGTNTTFGAAGMTPINGQTWGACNYYPIATVDDGSCDYTSCAGCTDPLYIEYDVVFTQPSPSAAIAAGYCTTLIVSGCTDATAFNYDPINPPNADCAGVVGGTDTSCCQPVVNGCMDDTLNNDGTTYAASNYSGPPVGSANTDDGSCNDYNCPYGLNSSISSGGASFVFKVLNFTTPYAFSDITRTATIGGTVVASFASSNNVYQGTDNIGKRFSEPTAGYFTAGVDTSITVDFNVTTTDGNCDVNATTKTFTIGCMDPNADVSGGFDIADNTQCDYTGCMISNACNYETYYNIQDNGTCVYCGDPAAYNYDGAVGSCTSLCFYTGCMDDTLQADGSGYAASNYITTNPADTLPCNTTGVTGDAGYDSAFDNDCCTYNTTPGVEFSILFGEIPQVFYDTTDTGYTEGSMSTITIGSGGTTLTHAGNSQASMNATTNSRLAFAWVNGSLPITSGSFGWHPYVNNGQLDISVTNAVFNGNCDNPSINDQLPTGYASDSVSWSVGCKTDSTAFNYDPNVDLHLPSSCVAVNSGCMDDNAWATIPSNNTATAAGLSGYDAAYNTACGTSGSTTDTSCCCFDTACDVFAALGTTSYNLGNQELTIPITLVPCARKYQYATRHYDGSWNSWSTATDVPASQTTLGNIVEGVSVLWPTMYGNNSVNKQIRVRAVCTDATPTTYSPWQQATVTYTY